MVLALSDTQVVTGASILASGYSQIRCGISIFHWHIVVFLAWFSSATHLATITFLRRYIHDNHVFRYLRLILMALLVGMLVVALIPTGGDCGIFSNGAFEISNSSAYTYPGAPALCCFKMIYERGFIGTSGFSQEFLSMIASEVLLLSGSITRAVKMHRTSADLARRWLSVNLSRWFKSWIRNIEEKNSRTTRKSARSWYLVNHCSGMILVVTSQAICDLVDSLLWEVSHCIQICMDFLLIFFTCKYRGLFSPWLGERCVC
jgi:hypothetical protein